MAGRAVTGDTRAVEQGAAFDRFVQTSDLPMTALTLAWLPVLLVPLFVHVDGAVASSLDVTDYAIWAVFALEYLARLRLAQHRWAYVRGHPFDLLVVVVPFFRPLRLLRLLRWLRVGSVVSDGAARARQIITHKGLHIVLLAALVLVVGWAGIVTLAEEHAAGSNIHDFGQGLWWAIVTVTTVGYGDKYPVTPAGQGVAVFLMLLGSGLIGVITATVASFFVEESKSGREAELVERLERIEQIIAEFAGRRTDVPRPLEGNGIATSGGSPIADNLRQRAMAPWLAVFQHASYLGRRPSTARFGRATGRRCWSSRCHPIRCAAPRPSRSRPRRMIAGAGRRLEA